MNSAQWRQNPAQACFSRGHYNSKGKRYGKALLVTKIFTSYECSLCGGIFVVKHDQRAVIF